MHMFDRENSGIRGFLKEVGHKNWARCHFNNRRYSMMTSNNVESLNVMNVNPRDFLITRLFEFLRRHLQQWFYERREAVVAMLTVLASTPQDNLVCIYKKSMEIKVIVLALVP